MPESRSRRWTEEELALLRQLIEREEPLSAIAARLNRTVLAVRTKAAHKPLLPADRPSPGPDNGLRGAPESDRER
jgi:hypothetical protein